MISTITGFPRIGQKRELKFALERYFAKDLSWQNLKQEAAQLRHQHYQLQKDAHIDLIPVGDFSFYDNLLDMAVLFNIIPKRYLDAQLSPDETYFAMARGFQSSTIDLKALPMKKWFNTNYHYIEPEFDGQTQLSINDESLLELLAEARELTLNYKVALIGPFTLLKLTRYVNQTSVEDLKQPLLEAYLKLLAKLKQQGSLWVSLAEPALVRDLSDADKKLFVELYQTLLTGKNGLKINLETYFGDIRDIYSQVIELDFDGIALDFVEGKQTTQLIDQYGFPRHMLLTAGVVSGKNIWRSNYEQIIKKLQKLQEQGLNLAIGTSCSLLHVPFTTACESGLDQKITQHLSFAVEKLTELKELKLIINANEGFDEYLKANARLFSESRTQENPEVAQRLANLKEQDFQRLPQRSLRQKLQMAKLNLPLLPTTTIGSFPQTPQVRALRRQFKQKQITKEVYQEEIKKMIASCIQIQDQLGLDVLVHGEFERNDMVEYFGEHLDGCIFTSNGWVQSYGSRCVKPPIIWSDISRRQPITVETATFAQSCTTKPVKGMLTGPVTILNWSFPRVDVPLKTMILQLALALKDEVEDLEKAGIRIIQIDEAALKEKLPLRRSDWEKEYLDFAIPAFRLLQSQVKPETQIHTHMCYSEFNEIISWIDAMDADVITFEASRSDFTVLDALKAKNFQTQVGPGVYDIHSPRVPSVEEITSALQRILSKTDLHKVWVNPDCGLKTRKWPETQASLKNLVQAACLLRDELESKRA